ncbi:MAG: hypothetical protein JO342_18235 [Solirubrobacterales bacterium]|nr:hypothetical protein [Solirubrobacterales bacterium]
MSSRPFEARAGACGNHCHGGGGETFDSRAIAPGGTGFAVETKTSRYNDRHS